MPRIDQCEDLFRSGTKIAVARDQVLRIFDAHRLLLTFRTAVPHFAPLNAGYALRAD